MRTKRFSLLLGSAIALITLSGSGCAEKPATMPELKDKVVVASSAVTAAASNKWSDIKDSSYEMRANFLSGLKGMQSQLDLQVEELTAKRKSLASNVSTTNWDFTMKEMEASRSAFKSIADDLSKASSETWMQQKDKVGVAWVRTQDAYAKVKASITQ